MEMTTSYFMSGCTWVTTVLIAVCGLMPAAWAQGSAEDVHITPRTEHVQTQNQQPTEDAAFCSRNLRALEWSLSPSVTSLTQVPSPYDFGPEMNIFPCPRS